MLPVPSSGGAAADADHAALQFVRVCKTFVSGPRRIEALKDVSMRALAGRITGLIGPDGAGKTTLMRLAAGLLNPEAGRLTVLGTDVTLHPLKVQSEIGYMPQRFGLYEELTVQENLDLYADLQGVPVPERALRYSELMEMTGLVPFVGRMAGRLSGGMKQKLGLACTLIRAPSLLILDEPTVGVDPVSRRDLWAILARLVKDEGVSVLLSTAYLDEAERCEEVTLLHEGHMLGQGAPGDFSRYLQGRTFTVTVPGRRRRTVQQALANTPGVLDAVILGDSVRLVMDRGTRPVLDALLPGESQAVLEPAPPRFEDGYIVTLKAETSGEQSPVSPPAPPSLSANGAHQIPPAIEVSGVQRRFGDFYAVKDVSFTVYPGEVFGLLGANGAGKSTTFRMLCGLLPASGGTLRVAGKDLRHSAAVARSRIGYMSQKFSLYGNLSVLQNLSFFGNAYGLRGRHRLDRLDWAQDTFHLRSVAGAASEDLPLGYKQRLSLACALMHEPDILFLDEPTSGVDPLARREFWAHINALAEKGVTVLVTTHFMEEAEYCDRLAIMAAGEILALGTPAEIKARIAPADLGRPSMEDAFIALIEGAASERANP